MTVKGLFVMLRIFSAVIIALVLLSGCANQPEPMPQIVTSSQTNIPDLPSPSEIKINGYIPSSWIPPQGNHRNWQAIVIHHSATDNGNSSIFDTWHREHNNWDGVGYDFVIGNGTDSGNGEVEVTFRWTQQRTGAHCGGTDNNWANKYGIGICLVGNFNKYSPTPQQLSSLRKLVRFLMERYNIPKSKIYGHRTTPGARKTDCPGRNFPLTRFKQSL